MRGEQPNDAAQWRKLRGEGARQDNSCGGSEVCVDLAPPLAMHVADRLFLFDDLRPHGPEYPEKLILFRLADFELVE